MASTPHPMPRTVEEILHDFRGRRAGLVKALTVDFDQFHQQCDPGRENLCLYGHPNETWELKPPVEKVPPELPDPAVGINFARDVMLEKDWLSHVAAHSDAWLVSLAFCFCARLRFGESDREWLFDMINVYPTVCEEVVPRAVQQVKEQADTHNNVVAMSAPKEEEDKQETSLCGACGEENTEKDEFSIWCHVCERWFHGKCVEITPAETEHINQYKCPTCRTNKMPQV